MTSWFTNSLSQSWLLRPWVNLARTSDAQIEAFLTHSRLFGPLIKSLTASKPIENHFTVLLNRLLLGGVALLFVLLSFGSTGQIGALTWLLLGVVLFLAILKRAQWIHRFTIIDGFVGCFLASAALSTAFSSYFHTSLIGLAKMMTFVAGYIVFRAISHHVKGIRGVLLLGLLVLIGLGESLVGFYQHINHIQPLATWSDPSINPELQMDRIFGTLKPSNPNLLAGFLTPCLAIAIGLGVLLQQGKVKLLGWASLASAALILVAMIWTGSRGGYLAIGTIFLCWFGLLGHLIWHSDELSQQRWMKPAWLITLIVSIVLVSGGILSSEKLRARVASIFAMREDSSISYRLNVYHSASEMVRDNPIVGIGPGNSTFKLVYGLYMVPGYNALGSYSVPLEITVQQGFIGIFIFLSLLAVLKIRTFMALDSQQLCLSEKILIIIFISGILGSFMYGIFDTILYRPSVNLLFWYLVAQLAVLTEPAIQPLPQKAGKKRD